jgi:hypothetical protein
MQKCNLTLAYLNSSHICSFQPINSERKFSLPDCVYLLVSSLGVSHLIPYYLPVMTTLMLVIRTHQINQRNKRSVHTILHTVQYLPTYSS